MNKRCSCHRFTPVITRREMLRLSASGFGYLALASLLSELPLASPLQLKLL